MALKLFENPFLTNPANDVAHQGIEWFPTRFYEWKLSDELGFDVWVGKVLTWQSGLCEMVWEPRELCNLWYFSSIHSISSIVVSKWKNKAKQKVIFQFFLLLNTFYDICLCQFHFLPLLYSRLLSISRLSVCHFHFQPSISPFSVPISSLLASPFLTMLQIAVNPENPLHYTVQIPSVLGLPSATINRKICAP